jgi:hypothetical protein
MIHTVRHQRFFLGPKPIFRGRRGIVAVDPGQVGGQVGESGVTRGDIRLCGMQQVDGPARICLNARRAVPALPGVAL